MEAEARALLTHEAYFALERATGERHEYVAGRVYAMVGGTGPHSEIAANTIMTLGVQLRQRPCKVYTSDLRIAIRQADIYAYPDLSVVCGEPQFTARGMALLNPTVIFEILSPSTAAYDQGLKFLRYQQIASLRDYVLVEQHTPFVRAFSRDEQGRWVWSAAEGMEATLALPSIDCQLPLVEVYAKVDFAEAAG